MLKGAVPLHYLLKRAEIARPMDQMLRVSNRDSAVERRSTFAVMGHSRLVTNGSQLNDVNNQPVVKDGVVGIHTRLS